MKLTDLAVASVKAPASGRVEIWDSMLPGFGLRISDKGTKSWVVLYRIRGHAVGKRRLTIGRYPIISLAKARERARKVFDGAYDGIDRANVPDPARTERAEKIEGSRCP